MGAARDAVGKEQLRLHATLLLRAAAWLLLKCQPQPATSQPCLPPPAYTHAYSPLPQLHPAGRLVPAALLYGLAVHWRLYPIIYALPLLRHFALQRQHAAGAAGAAGLRRSTRQAVAASTAGARPGPLRHVLHAAAVAVSSLVSPAGAVFGALSGGLFIGLAAAFYRLWGDQFLHETYLYHASRVDPRHNFSAYFYPAYLASSGGPQAARWDVGW